jgi:hypothetical protein
VTDHVMSSGYLNAGIRQITVTEGQGFQLLPGDEILSHIEMLDDNGRRIFILTVLHR